MDNKYHIVHVINSLRVGGSQRSVLRLASSPEMKKYRHSVICLNGTDGEFRRQFIEQGIAIYSCRLRAPTQLRLPSARVEKLVKLITAKVLSSTFKKRMTSLLRSVGADLVHSHVEGGIHLQAQAALRQIEVPWIWTLRGEYYHSPEWQVVAQLVRCLDKAFVTAVSCAALESANRDLKLPANKVFVIPNGIDRSEYNPTIDRDPLWRQRHGIPSDALLFGASGRLVQIKRFDLFIDAAARLLTNTNSVRFVIAGNGPLRTALEEHIERLGLESQFHLAGYQADMPRFLREIDVMVLPSDSEGFGNVLVEACAMGVPCIATAVGGVPEILQSGAGILIEPGSPQALAEAMKCMLNPDARASYAKHTRAVAERYSIDAVSRQYDALYRGLLS